VTFLNFNAPNSLYSKAALAMCKIRRIEPSLASCYFAAKSGRIAMKKLLASAVILAILSSPAFAQLGKKEDDPLVLEEKEKQKQAETVDKQYKQMMERLRKDKDTGAAKTDPWSNMRTPNDGKR
jgi:hypothetical protein